jgi:hypothetical protein
MAEGSEIGLVRCPPLIHALSNDTYSNSCRSGPWTMCQDRGGDAWLPFSEWELTVHNIILATLTLLMAVS